MLKHPQLPSEELAVSALPDVKFLTLSQVAALLQVSRGTVYNLINDEGLPYVQINRSHKRFPLASLLWWLARREQSNHPFVYRDLQQRSTALSELPDIPQSKPSGKGTSTSRTRHK